MKKSMLLTLLAVAMIASLVTAGSYDLVSIPAPGYWTSTVSGTGVGKVVLIEVSGSTVADGTVLLYKMSPSGTSSNLQYSLTCSSGAVVKALTSTNTFYIASGERIYRTGTATNGACRIILE